MGRRSGMAGTPRGADSEQLVSSRGVPDMVIQRILRHANVSTTATYYIKTAADDVRNAMAKLENVIPAVNEVPAIVRDTFATRDPDARAVPTSIN
jgi:hypothetical protein